MSPRMNFQRFCNIRLCIILKRTLVLRGQKIKPNILIKIKVSEVFKYIPYSLACSGITIKRTIQDFLCNCKIKKNRYVIPQ